MRLLWVTHRRRDEMSSSSREGISSALEEAGWSIDWASPDGDLAIPRSKRLGFGHRSFTRNLERRLQQTDLSVYDVAIVEWTGVAGAVQTLLGASLPWVIMDRSPPVSRGLAGWFQALQYKEAWNMARMFAAGRVVKSEFMAQSQAWSKPSATILAGVDLHAFSVAPLNESVQLVCHGSMDHVRELHRLDRLGRPVHLFGAGSFTGKGTKHLRISGPADQQGVAARLQEADVGLLHLPNREVWQHASPLKVAEYAASGLCVVASEVSGLQSFQDQAWLKLIPLGDDDALKVAVEEFASIPIEQRRELGQQARTFAEQHLAWTQVSRHLVDLLNEVKR